MVPRILLLLKIALILLFFNPIIGRATTIKIVAPKYVLIGNPFKVKLYFNSKNTKIKIKWLGREIKITPKKNTYSLLLGTDIKKVVPGVKKLTIFYNKNKIKKYIYVKKRKTSITKIHVSKRFSHLSKKDLDKYFQEKNLVKSVLYSFTPNRFYTKDFIPPIIPFKITSEYGKMRIINNTKRSIHTGIDIKAPENTPVRAINSGKVALVLNQLFSGKSIYIDHGEGVVSMYFHLKKVFVHPGEKVKKGEIIGLSGKTGRITGPHLHLGVSILGEMVDPKNLIDKF